MKPVSTRDKITLELVGGMSPQAVQRDRQLANSQFGEATSGAPVQHWTQALNRVAQGLGSSMRETRAATAEQEAATLQRQALTDALAGGDLGNAATTLMGNAGTADQGAALAGKVIADRQAQARAASDRQYQDGAMMRETQRRAQIATQYGLQEGTPEFQQFVLTGRLQQSGANDPTAPSSVREWEHFSKLSPEDQQRYLAMKRQSQFLDVGTGYVRPDVMNPGDGPVQTVDKNIAEAEREKVVGRETGEGQMGLPKMARGLEMYERKGEEVAYNIDRAIELAGQFGTTGFVGGLSKAVQGTPAYSLARALDPIIGNIGFDELQSMRDNSPTGGALGQVAVQELAMLQSVLGSLDQAQQPQDVIMALQRIKQIRADFAGMKRRAYAEDVARFGAAAVPRPEGVQQPAAGQPQPASQQRPDPLGLFGN